MLSFRHILANICRAFALPAALLRPFGAGFLHPLPMQQGVGGGDELGDLHFHERLCSWTCVFMYLSACEQLNAQTNMHTESLVKLARLPKGEQRERKREREQESVCK
jgi:hypothetical protein